MPCVTASRAAQNAVECGLPLIVPTAVPTAAPTAPPRRHRVIGIDPGSRLCGWGLVELSAGRPVSVDNGVIVLDPALGLAGRMALLLQRLGEVLAEYQPTSAAIEGIFQHRNPRSALILGHARGVALAAVARAGLEVAEYTPQQVKKAVTGTGRADKLQIQQVVTQRLDLPEPPQADAADAVAIALCHVQHLAFPLPTNLPVPAPQRGSRRRSQAALATLVAQQAQERTARAASKQESK